jgi:hypothetical protein
MRKSIDRSFLTRLAATAALFLVLTTAGAVVRAETVTVQGADGAPGANGVNPGDIGGPGEGGESVTAGAGSVHPITAPLNRVTATGGNGGDGGAGFVSGDFPAPVVNGSGGNGGAATATAATAIA